MQDTKSLSSSLTVVRRWLEDAHFQVYSLGFLSGFPHPRAQECRMSVLDIEGAIILILTADYVPKYRPLESGEV